MQQQMEFFDFPNMCNYAASAQWTLLAAIFTTGWMTLQLRLPVWTPCWCSRSLAAGWGGRWTDLSGCKLNRNTDGMCQIGKTGWWNPAKGDVALHFPTFRQKEIKIQHICIKIWSVIMSSLSVGGHKWTKCKLKQIKSRVDVAQWRCIIITLQVLEWSWSCNTISWLVMDETVHCTVLYKTDGCRLIIWSKYMCRVLKRLAEI